MKEYYERVKSVLEKQEHCGRIKSILEKQKRVNHNSIMDIRIKRAMEELGEFARAERNWSHSFSKENREALIEEAVDCVICSLALFVATDAELNTFDEIFKRKLLKWERNIENSVD